MALRSIILLLGVTLPVSNAQDSKPVQPLSASQLAERSIHRRAVEAVIWAMPAVNYELMLQQALKAKGGVNQVVYWSKPVDWKNQTLTPNPDAIYFMIFFNTKEGPVVIDVPPAEGGSFAANIDNIWQMPLEDAGPNGADKGKGGRYLILPPGYKGKTPEGFIVLQSDTFGGYALLRSNLASHADADVAKSVEYGKRLKIYPLSKADKPAETIFTDAKDELFDSTIPYDLRFFQSLNRIIQSEPWLIRDKAMIDSLKTIGIEKGKPFQPNTKTVEIMNAAAAEAHAILNEKLEVGFPPFYSDSIWGIPAFPEAVQETSSGYASLDQYPVDARALTYSIGYVGIKRLGTAQFYLMTGKDKEGQSLDGSRTYRLVVPANAPTKQYWSATLYDRDTHALIKNMNRASCSSNYSTMQKNADGSVDLYFGPNSPPGKESNWVPTDKNGKFEVLFRLYGPDKSLAEKAWRLPNIEPMK
ncbi:MAG: DUF1254 domain-containing protein [Pirellulales bacterium]